MRESIKSSIMMLAASFANILTALRIVLSAVLLTLEPLCPAFYCVYTAAGLTDAVDGTVARKTGTQSAFGEKLDSAADVIFFTAAVIKLLPVYSDSIGPWLWLTIAFLVYLRIKNAIVSFAINGRLIMQHTLLNKLTGLVLFLMPYACAVLPMKVYGGICAAVALAAGIDEFIRIIPKRK